MTFRSVFCGTTTAPVPRSWFPAAQAESENLLPPSPHHLIRVKLCARKRGCGSHNFRCGGHECALTPETRHTCHLPANTQLLRVSAPLTSCCQEPPCVCVFVCVCYFPGCGKLRVCFLRSTRSVQIFCQHGPWRGAVGDPAAPLLAGPCQCGCGHEPAPTVWAVSPRPILYKQIAQRAGVKALQIPRMVI